MRGQAPCPIVGHGAWRLVRARREAEVFFERSASVLGEYASDKVPRLTGRAAPQIASGCPNRNKTAGSGTPCRNAPLATGGGRRRWLDCEQRFATTVLAVCLVLAGSAIRWLGKL